MLRSHRSRAQTGWLPEEPPRRSLKNARTAPLLTQEGSFENLTQLFRRARRRVPTCCVRLLSEVCVGEVGFREVRGILNRRCDHEIQITVRLFNQIIIFSQCRVCAVRNPILAQVSRLEPGSDDLQGTCPLRLAAAAKTKPSDCRREFPRRFGNTLPVITLLLRGAEVEHTSLRSGVRLELYRLIILPGDVQAARQAHDVCGAVALALLSGGLILRRVPGISCFAAVGIQGNARVVSLWRSEHPPAPVFRHDGYPVAAHVKWGHRPGCSR